jgi:hypothetical protein
LSPCHGNIRRRSTLSGVASASFVTPFPLILPGGGLFNGLLGGALGEEIEGMKRISYAGESFLTADRAADALVDLAAVLGESHKAEVVELPVIDREGRTVPVRIVVSQATQLLSVPEESPYLEPDLDDIVRRLEERAREMSHRYVAVVTPPAGSIIDLDDIDSG